jgi:hypothetical protein
VLQGYLRVHVSPANLGVQQLTDLQVLQECYKRATSATRVLQVSQECYKCYKSVTSVTRVLQVLQECYKCYKSATSVTRINKDVPMMLQGCYKGVSTYRAREFWSDLLRLVPVCVMSRKGKRRIAYYCRAEENGSVRARRERPAAATEKRVARMLCVDAIIVYNEC